MNHVRLPSLKPCCVLGWSWRGLADIGLMPCVMQYNTIYLVSLRHLSYQLGLTYVSLLILNFVPLGLPVSLKYFQSWRRLERSKTGQNKDCTLLMWCIGDQMNNSCLWSLKSLLQFPEKNEKYMAMEMSDRRGKWDVKRISVTQL